MIFRASSSKFSSEISSDARCLYSPTPVCCTDIKYRIWILLFLIWFNYFSVIIPSWPQLLPRLIPQLLRNHQPIALFPMCQHRCKQEQDQCEFHLPICSLDRICMLLAFAKFRPDSQVATHEDIERRRDRGGSWVLKCVLVVETVCMNSPKQFSLVAEPWVGVKSSKNVGGEGKPQVLSEESMGFKEPSIAWEDRQHDILASKLEHCESSYFLFLHSETAESKGSLLVAL